MLLGPGPARPPEIACGPAVWQGCGPRKCGSGRSNGLGGIQGAPVSSAGAWMTSGPLDSCMLATSQNKTNGTCCQQEHFLCCQGSFSQDPVVLWGMSTGLSEGSPAQSSPALQAESRQRWRRGAPTRLRVGASCAYCVKNTLLFLPLLCREACALFLGLQMGRDRPSKDSQAPDCIRSWRASVPRLPRLLWLQASSQLSQNKGPHGPPRRGLATHPHFGRGGQWCVSWRGHFISLFLFRLRTNQGIEFGGQVAPEECLLWWDIEKHSQGVPSEAWLQDLKKPTDKPSQEWPQTAPGGGYWEISHWAWGSPRAGAETHPLARCSTLSRHWRICPLSTSSAQTSRDPTSLIRLPLRVSSGQHPSHHPLLISPLALPLDWSE